MAMVCGRPRMPRVNALESRPAADQPLLMHGSSVLAKQLNADVRDAAAARTVLIEGDATLELVELARAIHLVSGRSGPYVVLDCGAAEPAIVERELFGDSPRRSGGDVEAISA